MHHLPLSTVPVVVCILCAEMIQWYALIQSCQREAGTKCWQSFHIKWIAHSDRQERDQNIVKSHNSHKLVATSPCKPFSHNQTKKNPETKDQAQVGQVTLMKFSSLVLLSSGHWFRFLDEKVLLLTAAASLAFFSSPAERRNVFMISRSFGSRFELMPLTPQKRAALKNKTDSEFTKGEKKREQFEACV